MKLFVCNCVCVWTDFQTNNISTIWKNIYSMCFHDASDVTQLTCGQKTHVLNLIFTHIFFFLSSLSLLWLKWFVQGRHDYVCLKNVLLASNRVRYCDCACVYFMLKPKSRIKLILHALFCVSAIIDIKATVNWLNSYSLSHTHSDDEYIANYIVILVPCE